MEGGLDVNAEKLNNANKGDSIVVTGILEYTESKWFDPKEDCDFFLREADFVKAEK